METGFIYVEGNVFETLIAISEAEQQKGLMRQPFPPPIMSFVYAEPRINKFWMAGTPSPLDIVFCYQNKICQIHHGEPFSTRQIGDNNFSDLVIEFPLGTVSSTGIKIGNDVGLIKPTIDDIRKIIANAKY